MNSDKCVLLVEDNEDSRFSLSRLLEFEGYRVLEAGDGAQAIDLAIREKPDLILMDLSLPVVDGLSAVKEIRQNESLNNTPIIALSAYDASDIQAKTRGAGFTDYATKPLEFEHLMLLMTKYLPLGGRA
jgi:CheY-like chemotaxis protein